MCSQTAVRYFKLFLNKKTRVLCVTFFLEKQAYQSNSRTPLTCLVTQLYQK